MTPPGAWEILEMSQRRVFVGIIKPPDLKVTVPWAQTLRELQLPPGSLIGTVVGLPFGPARNNLVKTTLDGGFGYCFMLDADTHVPPDCVMKLLGSGLDLVGGFYKQRFPPHKPAAAMLGIGPNGEQFRADLPPYNVGDTIPVHFLPAGATLYSRRLLEAVITKYPRPFEWGPDIEGLAGTRQGLSEDFDLCVKAMSLGFQPYLMTGIVCGHEMLTIVRANGIEVMM